MSANSITRENIGNDVIMYMFLKVMQFQKIQERKRKIFMIMIQKQNKNLNK